MREAKVVAEVDTVVDAMVEMNWKHEVIPDRVT